MKTENLSLAEALAAMQDGKRVRRASYLAGLELRMRDGAVEMRLNGRRWTPVGELSAGSKKARDWRVLP